MKITIIPAKTNKQTLKIAAYCRVSKSTEEQLNSIIVQKAYHEDLIHTLKDCEFVGVFADAGKSGLRKNGREERGKVVYRCSKRMHQGINKCPTSVTLNENEVFDEIRRYLKVEDLINIVIEDNINSIVVFENSIKFIK